MSYPPALFIMGPTGSGKTELAMRIVNNYPAEIISVDSAQIYKQMNIGTATPDAAILKKAPHRLINIIDPLDSYSVGQFRNDALKQMSEIYQKGNIPILAGGTMMYFRALQYGIAKLPNANPVIRARLEEEAKNTSWKALHQRLAIIDPESAKRIHPNDPQRLQRALEVYEITGQSLTFHHQSAQQEIIPWTIKKIGLIPNNREILKQHLTRRFYTMLEQGFIDEVKQLYERGDLNINLPSMRCVGYRQVWQYINGDKNFNSMKKHAIVATHQLAKRQLTWLRSEKELSIINPLRENKSFADKLVANILA